MDIINHIIQGMRHFVETDLGITFHFISLSAWLIGIIVFAGKKLKFYFQISTSWGVIAALLLPGLILPIIRLLFGWSAPDATLLNSLTIVAISISIFLLYSRREGTSFIPGKGSPPRVREAEIEKERYKIVFDGVYIYFRGYSAKTGKKVSIIVWEPGHGEMTIKNQGVGHSDVYVGEARYRIRIIHIGVNNVHVQIARL